MRKDRVKSSSTKTVPHDIALLGNCHRESISRSGSLQSAVGIDRLLWQTPAQLSSVLGSSTRYNWIATLWGLRSCSHRRFGQLHLINSSRRSRKSCRAPNSDRCGNGPRRRGLTKLLYHLRNDFGSTIDFSFSVESAERKTEAAPGAIALRFHCA